MMKCPIKVGTKSWLARERRYQHDPGSATGSVHRPSCPGLRHKLHGKPDDTADHNECFHMKILAVLSLNRIQQGFQNCKQECLHVRLVGKLSCKEKHLPIKIWCLDHVSHGTNRWTRDGRLVCSADPLWQGMNLRPPTLSTKVSCKRESARVRFAP